MNDFLFKLNAYNMPKTMVPGAFQTAFPVKWPLKFNMKLPAYAVGSDLTNLGKDLERLGFGPGTYRTYGANAGTLRQPIKTSNYIKEAQPNSDTYKRRFGQFKHAQGQQIADVDKAKVNDATQEDSEVIIRSKRTFGGFRPTVHRSWFGLGPVPEPIQKFIAGVNAAERNFITKYNNDVRKRWNNIASQRNESGINVSDDSELNRHISDLATAKAILSNLHGELQDENGDSSLNEQLRAVDDALQALVAISQLKKQLHLVVSDASNNLIDHLPKDVYTEDALKAYTQQYNHYVSTIEQLVDQYEKVNTNVLYPAYLTLSKSGLYNSENGLFITTPDKNGNLNIAAINDWFTAGRYTHSSQEKQRLMWNAISKGIINTDKEFIPAFADTLLQVASTKIVPTTIESLLQDLKNRQPQPIKRLPTLTEIGATEKETPAFDLLNINKESIRNALGYVISARRAIEQNMQQSDIQSAEILKNLTNLESSLGSAYAIADYVRNKFDNGERLPRDFLQTLQDRLTSSLANANSAINALHKSGHFDTIDEIVGTKFADELLSNPNVNQLLNKFGSPQEFDEDTANELQQKYINPNAVITTIKQITRSRDVTNAVGIPSSTTNRGIKIHGPEPQKPDISVVRESLYTVYPEEARKVETLETVMQDPVLNKYYNFTGHIDTLKKLRNQVEQLAGLVQQNPAYEMAYRRALSIYNNVLRSTLSFANVAAKDVYNLERIRRTINSQFGRFEQPGDALPEAVKKQIQQEKEKKITELFTMQKLWEDWKRQEESLRKLFTVNLRFKYRNEEEAEAALQEALDQRKKEFIRNKLIPALPIENRGRFGSDLKFTAQIENIIFNTNPQQFQKYITDHARGSAQNLARQYAATLLPQQAQAQQPQAQQVQAQQPLGQPLPAQQPLGPPLPEQQALGQELLNRRFLGQLALARQPLTPAQQPQQLPVKQPLGQQPQQPSVQPPSGRQPLTPAQPASVAQTPATAMQPTPTATQNLGPLTPNLFAPTGTGQNLNPPTGSNLPKVTKNKQL